MAYLLTQFVLSPDVGHRATRFLCWSRLPASFLSTSWPFPAGLPRMTSTRSSVVGLLLFVQLAHSIHGYTFAAPCCGIFSTWPAIAQQWHIMCTLNRQMSSFFDGLRCQIFRFSSMLLSKSRSYDIWQETQLSLTNRATPLEVSQGQSKHCTIRYVRYRFILVCFSNFVREIFDFKYAVTSKTGLGVLSRSLKMSPFDRAHMTYYWRSIVNMALSRVIFEIFNVENIATLKSRSGVNQGYWKWYHSIDCI